MSNEKVEKKAPRNPLTWPDLPFKELMCAIVVMVVLIVWSLWMDAPLGEIATPARTENPAKAPWYFVGLQELLVYFDPWYAGVVLPGIILVGLMMIPYLDTNRQAVGEYNFSKRKFAMVNFLVGYGLWMGAIVIGQLFRGPNWFFVWPWQSWENLHGPTEVVVMTNLSTATGLIGMALYFGVGFSLPIIMKWKLYRELDKVRYTIVMILALLMYAVPIKMVLRLAFDIRYVLVTPWFNI
jgi:hypothetical protein